MQNLSVFCGTDLNSEHSLLVYNKLLYYNLWYYIQRSISFVKQKIKNNNNNKKKKKIAKHFLMSSLQPADLNSKLEGQALLELLHISHSYSKFVIAILSVY